jgi:hypothetical protein
MKNLIINLLCGNGTTFGNLDYQTVIPVAAKFKAVEVKKVTNGLSVILFETIKDYNLYTKAVIKSALSNEKNAGKEEEILNFVQAESSFSHNNQCYSLVANKNDTSKEYLYWIANNSKTANTKTESVYYVNGKEVNKEDIKQYLTPSKAKEIFEPSKEVYNKTNDIWHGVKPRTLKLENIIALRANKQTI